MPFDGSCKIDSLNCVRVGCDGEFFVYKTENESPLSSREGLQRHCCITLVSNFDLDIVM
jgi:hypothetical protein